MIRAQFFPKSVAVTEQIQSIVECFVRVEAQIKSLDNALSSDQALSILRPHFIEVGMLVEDIYIFFVRKCRSSN